ncbi:MAG: hypothetical protein DDT20_01599 [Firmicutes bacterium]|nr:hypothetical protein [Bacillota bacterium]
MIRKSTVTILSSKNCLIVLCMFGVGVDFTAGVVISCFAI